MAVGAPQPASDPRAAHEEAQRDAADPARQFGEAALLLQKMINERSKPLLAHRGFERGVGDVNDG